jgi:ParB/RepB/Spo0J family partition protein
MRPRPKIKHGIINSPEVPRHAISNEPTDSAPSNTVLASAIEHLPIAALKAYERNPRIHGDRQIQKLAGTIRAVGFLVPITVDERNAIIAGHGRWAAAKELGLRTVPVIRADHLSADQVQAFPLADNRLGELSSWDETALALELSWFIEQNRSAGGGEP